MMERQHRIRTDKEALEGKLQTETKKGDGVQQSKHYEQHPKPPLASPPASSSSPSHEFSFTISLHQPSLANPLPSKSLGENKPNLPPPPFAVDLSPADDIFFDGHLLPLHLLSHLPVSPRLSINSTEGCTLPVKEKELSSENTQTVPNDLHANSTAYQERALLEDKGTVKSKSFSLFGLPKWKQGCEGREKGYPEGQKRKSKFDVSHFLQKYVRLIKPFISLRSNNYNNNNNNHRMGNSQIHRQCYSVSENLKLRGRLKGWRGRRDFSAPASMRTSPASSGLLMASGNITPTNYNNSTSESTMEELQAAIQAAIAHCKKSIDAEDKNKLP